MDKVRVEIDKKMFRHMCSMCPDFNVNDDNYVEILWTWAYWYPQGHSRNKEYIWDIPSDFFEHLTERTRFYMDEEDILEDYGWCIRPEDDIDLEPYMLGGDLDDDNYYRTADKLACLIAERTGDVCTYDYDMRTRHYHYLIVFSLLHGQEIKPLEFKKFSNANDEMRFGKRWQIAFANALDCNKYTKPKDFWNSAGLDKEDGDKVWLAALNTTWPRK